MLAGYCRFFHTAWLVDIFMPMDIVFWTILLAGALVGGFVNGLAGFGTGMFALAFWLQILPPIQAVPMVLVLSVISGIQGLYAVRQAVRDNPARLARFLLPALPGIPLGGLLLGWLDASVIKLLVALAAVSYGVSFAFRAKLPKWRDEAPVTDMAVGFAGGLLGGAASLSGMLPIMYCGMKPWPKNAVRAVLQPYNFSVLGLAIIWYAITGRYDSQILLWLVVLTPACLLSARFGLYLYQQLADAIFRRLVIILTGLAGLSLLLRELAGWL